MKVLIVEDEALIAMDLEWQMRDLGHDVVGPAATEEAALDLARTHRPDLALMDMHLAQGGNGLLVARQLRAELGIASLIISGSLHEIGPGDRIAIAPAGLLSKPIMPVELARAIADWQTGIAGV